MKAMYSRSKSNRWSKWPRKKVTTYKLNKIHLKPWEAQMMITLIQKAFAAGYAACFDNALNLIKVKLTVERQV
jgi:organic hydroperoxide reductase OsmC/OhrA